MAMSLQDYIDKYGEESGNKRYLGMQRRLETRKVTYAKHPYQRLTKEWFIWRYPEDGLARFEDHVNKSRQSEEAMIARHGEEAGRRKWAETVAKKNTVGLARAQYGEEADAILAEWYRKRKETQFNAPEDIKRQRTINRRKAIEPFLQTIRGRPRIDRFKEKYGEEEGIRRYEEVISKSFLGPCRMSKPAMRVYTTILSIIPEQWHSEILCDADGKHELMFRDKGKTYGYDFAHRLSSTILEFNGSFWHPEAPTDEIHRVTKKTFREMYETDITKANLANSRGYEVLVVREQMNQDQQLSIINEFCDRVIAACSASDAIAYDTPTMLTEGK